MPDPSSPGVRSPVTEKGGSWSALAPCGLFLGKVMSTGYPQRMQVGSHWAMTIATHFLYWAPPLPGLVVAIIF
jgi:hypothetical protein